MTITANSRAASNREERMFRNSSKKCLRGETQFQLLKELSEMKIGLREVEEYIAAEGLRSRRGLREMNFTSKVKNYKKEREIVGMIMRKKMRDCGKKCIELRKLKTQARNEMENSLGGKTRRYWRVLRETRKYSDTLREEIRRKNMRKIKFLSEKYGMRTGILDGMTEDEVEEFGQAEVFEEECEMVGDNLKEPEVVRGEGEELNLSEEERRVLALGPKFCVRNNLNEEAFKGAIEECIAKVKWDLKSDEEEGKKRKNSADIALRQIFTEEENEEFDEEDKMRDALRRMVYNPEEGTWSYSRKRVTDIKGNNQVILPGRLKKFEEEANLEMMRTELLAEYRDYVRGNCDEKGKQQSNLTREEERGLRNLKKRVKDGGITILPTDKSGRFAVMSVGEYLRAGKKHTDKDVEVNWETIKDTQNDLNGNMSMIIKFCRVGSMWKHGRRVRETMLNKSMSVCPMYLTYKDHKGWDAKGGTPAPTRPICGGNTGMNIHISEALSEFVEPLVDAYEGGSEVISSEDYMAHVEELNEGNTGWNKWSWWDGKKYVREDENVIEEYIACSVCELRGRVPPTPAPENEGKNAIVSSAFEDTFDQFVHELREELPVSDDEELPIVSDDEGMNDIVSSVPEDTSGLRKEDLCNCKVEYNEDWENYWDTEEGRNSSFWTREKDKRMIRVKASIVKRMRKEGWMRDVNIKEMDEDRVWRITEVLEEDVQDMEAPQVIVGCDVEALYPSLDAKECAEVVREEVMRTKIQWKDMDFVEGARMIALNRSAAWCRRSKLKRVLPVRRGRTGVRPGVTGEGPMGGRRGDQEQWVFPAVRPTEEERRRIVAEVIAITTEVMFKHHLYTFGGKTHRQKEGGPIGLRGTCAIARLTMCAWDRRWRNRMEELGVKILLYSRYMDDGRAHLPPFKSGWRWEEGEIRYKEAWRKEDADLSGEEITRRIVHESMQGVMEPLRFTTEIGEDDGWLPTLDLQVRVESNNLVSFKYYEKPTVTNVMVQKRSAMGENEKVQILSNDMVRRLATTDPRQDKSTRVKVVDQFAKKILTSGYSLQQTRRIILGGIRGWKRRLERAKEEGRAMYRKASSCQESRLKKKTLGKSTWFRGKKKNGNQAVVKNRNKGRRGGNPGDGVGSKEDRKLLTRSVLFVENSKDGELARRLRGVVERIQHILKFRIKVVERSGTPLRLMFPLNNIGGEGVCGRNECITCMQEGEGRKPPCTRRSVLYENVCKICNPGVTDPGTKLSPPLTNPSIYVGETARSIMERGADHWKGYKEQREDSHILKHHVLHHGGVGEPSFHLRAVGFFNSALSRQVAEAVRIAEWGEEVVLNSKSEFNRCQLGRLTLEKEQKPADPVVMEEEGDKASLEEQRVWERGKSMTRRVEEVISEGVLDRGLARSPPTKGRRMADTKDGGGRSKKLKHPVLEDDWGEIKDDMPEKEDDLVGSWVAKEQRPSLGLVRSGDQTQPQLPPPQPPGNTVVDHHPDKQDGMGEDPAQLVSGVEGCHEDSTSRDDILSLREIYSTKTQTSIVEYLASRNTEQEDRGGSSGMEQKSVRNRRLQDDSPIKKKNKKNKPLPGPSSGKMVELMKKFVKRGHDDSDRNGRHEAPEAGISDRNQVLNNEQQVSPSQDVQVSRKQVMSFASIDVRMKKTLRIRTVKDRVDAIEGETENVKCVLGSGRCGTHNAKLVRRVCVKKYSCIDPGTGKLVWKTRDVTSMECPDKAKRTKIASGTSVMSDQSNGGYNNNKKFKLDEK